MNTNVVRKSLVVGIILLFVGTCSIPAIAQNTEKQSSSRGNWLYVGGSGPGNYTRIQDAIDNASDGDTIIVFNETYKESISLNKQLNLIGIDQPTIEGTSQNVILISVDHCSIENFRIINEFKRIYIGSNYNMVKNCSINSSILLQNTSGNFFTNNQVTTCGFIVSDNSNYNLFSRNIIKHIKTTIYTYGIEVADSRNNSIINNTFIDIWLGVYLHSSNYCNVIDNSFSKCEIIIDGSLPSNYNSHTIQGNTIGEKKIYYYKNKNNLTVPQDAGQIFLMNCSNCIIQNFNINENHYFINLCYSSHNLISNNIIQNNSYHPLTTPNTIYLYESNQNIVSHNKLINDYWSVLLSQSKQNFIFDNTINEGSIYLYVSDSNNISSNVLDDHSVISVIGGNNMIKNNSLNNSGINIWGLGNYIVNNELKNHEDGIHIYSGSINNVYNNKVVGCGYGIYDAGGGNIYQGNDLNHNSIGLNLVYGARRIVRNNINNNELGLYLGGGYFNKIMNNNFILNILDARFEQSLFTLWLNNYWGIPILHPKIIFGTLTFYGVMGEVIKVIPWFNIDLRPRSLPVIID